MVTGKNRNKGSKVKAVRSEILLDVTAKARTKI